jgi:hypothetical protein
MRDLTRTREDVKYAEIRARQRVQALLLRHGRRYPRRSAWSVSYWRWLSERCFDHPARQIAIEESCEAVREATRWVQPLPSQIRDLGPAGRWPR